jgi:hypothetical protein
MRRVGTLQWFLPLLLSATALPTIAASPQSSSAQSKAEPQQLLRLAIGDTPWSMQINKPGFVVEGELTLPNIHYMQAHNKELGILLAVKVVQQSGERQTGIDGCRDYLLSEQAQISSIVSGKATNLETREFNGVPVFEYSIEVKGLRSQVLLTCLAKDEFSVELHMSKENFQPSDEELFTSILEAAQIVSGEETSAPESGAAPATSAPAQSQPIAPAQSEPSAPAQPLPEAPAPQPAFPSHAP